MGSFIWVKWGRLSSPWTKLQRRTEARNRRELPTDAELEDLPISKVRRPDEPEFGKDS